LLTGGHPGNTGADDDHLKINLAAGVASRGSCLRGERARSQRRRRGPGCDPLNDSATGE
jgi:hypothetical protein